MIHMHHPHNYKNRSKNIQKEVNSHNHDHEKANVHGFFVMGILVLALVF
jgi:hypothetical protein